MATPSGDGGGGGFVLKMFWFVMAVIVVIVLVNVGFFYCERYGECTVRYEDPRLQKKTFGGVTPTPAPSGPTTRSVERGAPAPAEPLPGDKHAVDCRAMGGERRINPTTGKRSCWVPSR